MFDGNTTFEKREEVRKKGRWGFIDQDSLQLQELIGGKV